MLPAPSSRPDNAHCVRAVKDKAQHAVIMDKTIQDRLNKDVLTYRLITTAVLVDRLKINGSLARKALADLESQGVIRKVVGHSKLTIYSMSPARLHIVCVADGKNSESCYRRRVGVRKKKRKKKQKNRHSTVWGVFFHFPSLSFCACRDL